MEYYIFNTIERKFFKDGYAGGLTSDLEEARKVKGENLKDVSYSESFENKTLLPVPVDMSKVKVISFVDFNMETREYYANFEPFEVEAYSKDFKDAYICSIEDDINLNSNEIRIPIEFTVIEEEKEPIQYYIFNKEEKRFFGTSGEGLVTDNAHKYSINNVEEKYIIECAIDNPLVLLIPCDIGKFEIETFTDFDFEDMTFYCASFGPKDKIDDIELCDNLSITLFQNEVRIPIKFRVKGEESWIEQSYIGGVDYRVLRNDVVDVVHSALPIERAEFDEYKGSFKQITDSIADLLKYKNEKYGNAVLDPLNIFSGKCMAGTRLDDKLSRIKNSEELRKNDVSDLIGYLILTCKEKGWTDFSEFKD